METEKKVTQKKFNFKEYYNTNSEFKARHKLKMKEKIFCTDCNALVNKYNLAKHKRTKIHETRIKLMAANKNGK
jgi:hypothetical protein